MHETDDSLQLKTHDSQKFAERTAMCAAWNGIYAQA
jgi:hypothetical protein